MIDIEKLAIECGALLSVPCIVGLGILPRPNKLESENGSTYTSF